MAKLTPEGFENFFKYFKGESQQKSGIKMLFDAMPASLLDDEANWITEYRESPSVNGSTEIPQQAVDFIARWEGFRSAPYLDGVGVATIGYGATFYPSGKTVTMQDPPITEARAKEILANHCLYFWNMEKLSIPFWDEMNDNQHSALLSFGFNLGGGFFNSAGFSTISRVLRDKDWAGVPAALELYSNPNDPAVHEGLLRRRKEEGQLWLA